ncbi:UNVERIFIED_CONTAM: hypothetical protein K2H54_004167 [Gekko kuhli]
MSAAKRMSTKTVQKFHLHQNVVLQAQLTRSKDLNGSWRLEPLQAPSAGLCTKQGDRFSWSTTVSSAPRQGVLGSELNLRREGKDQKRTGLRQEAALLQQAWFAGEREGERLAQLTAVVTSPKRAEGAIWGSVFCTRKASGGPHGNVLLHQRWRASPKAGSRDVCTYSYSSPKAVGGGQSEFPMDIKTEGKLLGGRAEA